MDKKETQQQYQKQYYQDHKKEYLERSRKWKRENPEKYKEINDRYWGRNPEKLKEVKKKWFRENFNKRLLAQAKNSSKAKGMEFNLELSDIIIPDLCPYLGIKLDVEVYQGRIPNRASIDRIDSSKGYIKGNVQILSNLANRMKNNATKEQLLTFAYNVIKLHEEI